MDYEKITFLLIAHKLRSRNNVLNALAGSTWGMDKETFICSYKTIVRSMVNYAPSLSDTQWRNIQIWQNASLRTVTGCLKISSPNQLREKTEILPVKEYNIMLRKQFHLGCHRRCHRNYNITQVVTLLRHVRKDHSKNEENIRNCMKDS